MTRVGVYTVYTHADSHARVVYSAIEFLALKCQEGVCDRTI